MVAFTWPSRSDTTLTGSPAASRNVACVVPEVVQPDQRQLLLPHRSPRMAHVLDEPAGEPFGVTGHRPVLVTPLVTAYRRRPGPEWIHGLCSHLWTRLPHPAVAWGDLARLSVGWSVGGCGDGRLEQLLLLRPTDLARPGALSGAELRLTVLRQLGHRTPAAALPVVARVDAPLGPLATGTAPRPR